MLTDNATYPELQPLLPGLTTLCDELEAANAEVLFNGGKIAYENKHEKEQALRALITDIAERVQVISAGDKAKILSAGFEVRKAPEPHMQLGQPQDLRAFLTGYTGKVGLDWELVSHARFYKVWMATGDLNRPEWQLVGTTTKSRFDVEGLAPGTVYTFRVNAVGTRATSIFSDNATLMAA